MKTGIFISVIPGARIFTMVAMRFIPDRVGPMPASCRPQM